MLSNTINHILTDRFAACEVVISFKNLPKPSFSYKFPQHDLVWCKARCTQQVQASGPRLPDVPVFLQAAHLPFWLSFLFSFLFTCCFLNIRLPWSAAQSYVFEGAHVPEF